ncbi:hypothetical protein Acr_11g0003710 [Actinidia rufa]|uniref:Uncharacterized protein n=1 Tax=Actinidia rufa TaxID=165716 RepID=A0A7J0FBL5_9ERIC|nr:hypothetical protein Acr_11g0003710 [Actinidia rufa]
MVLMRERTVVLEGAAADGGLKERGDEFFGGDDTAEVRRGDVLEEDVVAKDVVEVGVEGGEIGGRKELGTARRVRGRALGEIGGDGGGG